MAEWLARRGIAAFVLKYRTIDTGATEKEFVANVNAMMDRLGQAGPSSRDILDPDMQRTAALAADDARQAVRVVRERAPAWGLAADRIGLLGFSAGAIITVEVALFHDPASRPDFAAPIYGAPMWRVTPPDDAPPLFVVWASDDPLISPVRGSDLYLAWYGAGKPAEMHVYATGGHGFGLQPRGLPVDRWIERFEEWLQAVEAAARERSSVRNSMTAWVRWSRWPRSPRRAAVSSAQSPAAPPRTLSSAASASRPRPPARGSGGTG